MKTDQANGKHFLTFFTVFLTIAITNSFAQIPPEVALHGYADTVFINGKVVSMDDKSTSTEVGNIYQGVAVKGDKIVKLGTTQEIRALAGPDTKILDLQGRTLLPGIVEPHMHIYGEAVQHLDRFGFKYPPKASLFPPPLRRAWKRPKMFSGRPSRMPSSRWIPANGWWSEWGPIPKNLPPCGCGPPPGA